MGISISEFWELTPYELKVAVRGYTKRKEREAKEYQEKLKNERILSVRQAFLISRWVWQKKISESEIRQEMGLEKINKVMTDEQMLAQAKALTIMFGGEIVIKGGEKDG